MRQDRIIALLLAGLAGLQPVSLQARAAVKTEGRDGGVKAAGSGLHPRVKMVTSLGDLVVELDADKAPSTTMHFIRFVQDHFYDGTIFHRVRKQSVIQGGVYTPDMVRKETRLKTGFAEGWTHALKSPRGSIALLHGQDPEGKDEAEFFISLVDRVEPDTQHRHLRYAVFGHVVEGFDTVEKIAQVPVGPHPRYAVGRISAVPIKPVVIQTVRLISSFDDKAVEARIAEVRELARDPIGHLVKKLEKKTGRKVVTTRSGLRYIDFVVGKGPKPLLDETVEFQYRGTLLDGTEFESSYTTHPVIRRIKKLILGLQEGLTTMHEGGQRTIIVPPELGYGSAGIPRHIPGDATLVFEIELLDIK